MNIYLNILINRCLRTYSLGKNLIITFACTYYLNMITAHDCVLQNNRSSESFAFPGPTGWELGFIIQVLLNRECAIGTPYVLIPAPFSL